MFGHSRLPAFVRKSTHGWLNCCGIGRRGRVKMKNPPRQRGGGLKKTDCSSDSLAVFYVEQVALNRHVSSNSSIVRSYKTVKPFFPTSCMAGKRRRVDGKHPRRGRLIHSL